MSATLVHVVDDDAALRDSLSFLLETSGLSVRTYASASELLDRLETLEPGCILTDVRMPGIGGLELVRRVKAMGLAHPVVVMTGHADVPLAIEAMKAGVADFIEKPFDEEVLLRALRDALDIGAERLRHEQELAAIRARMELLSGRERDVLEGLVAGRANKVIAFDLGISPRTVEIYRANVMTKMQASSLSELVRMVLAVERPR